MKTKLLVCLLMGLFSVGTALAADSNSRKCPNAYQDEIDGYGTGGSANPYYMGDTSDGNEQASDLTTCIKKTNGIKVVLNFSSNTLGPNGKVQLINNAVNMLSNYEHIWGITPENPESTPPYGLKMNIVAHFQGAKYLLDDAKYKAQFTPGCTNPDNSICPGNPEKARIQTLIAEGVHVYMCQTSMRANGWKTADLMPGVEMVPAGVIALVDFAQDGWAVITP
jgi:intracellular sulfur oxidation DsrE/DsrF family protein